MKLQRSTRHNSLALFNLIPLINVLFLVFAFFTLGQAFIFQPGLSVTLPTSPFTLSRLQRAQIVSITAGAFPSIYFHDKQVTQEELEKLLARQEIKERSLLIRADRAVPLEMVTDIMNLGLRHGYAVTMASTAPR